MRFREYFLGGYDMYDNAYQRDGYIVIDMDSVESAQRTKTSNGDILDKLCTIQMKSGREHIVYAEYIRVFEELTSKEI